MGRFVKYYLDPFIPPNLAGQIHTLLGQLYTDERINALLSQYLDSTVNCVVTKLERERPVGYSRSQTRVSKGPIEIKTCTSRRIKAIVAAANEKNTQSPSAGDVNAKLLEFIKKKPKGVMWLSPQTLVKHLQQKIKKRSETSIDKLKESERKKKRKHISITVKDKSGRYRDLKKQFTNRTVGTTLPKINISASAGETLFGKNHGDGYDPPTSDDEDESGALTTKSRQKMRVQAPKGGGYCECCNQRFEILTAHIASASHQNFIRNSENFLAIKGIFDEVGQSVENT